MAEKHQIKAPVYAAKGRKKIGTENRKIIKIKPYCIKSQYNSKVKCECKQCNSGTIDQITNKKLIFDNMMDPFMPIYKDVNSVCRTRKYIYPYPKKCCNSKCEFETIAGTENLRKICNNSSNNSQNFFDRQKNDFDNQFNFREAQGAAIQPLPFVSESRCETNVNTINEFEEEANNFANKFLF